MKIESLYVAAKDFDRTKAFYTDTLFRKEPSSSTDRFVFYDIEGFQFGLFNPEVTDESVTFANNCVPTFEVSDFKVLHDRLKTKGVDIIMPLQEVNDTVIFQCLDTEGNVLEFYRWKEGKQF